MNDAKAHSINDIRTAIRELTARAELARKEGRPEDAAELEQRIQGLSRGARHAPLDQAPSRRKSAAVKDDRRYICVAP